VWLTGLWKFDDSDARTCDAATSSSCRCGLSADVLGGLSGISTYSRALQVCSTHVLLRASASARGFLMCFPRFDSRVSQSTLPAAQLLQGCRSVTSHLTRRALQVTHANFARFRGGSDMLPKLEVCFVWKTPKSVTKIVREG